MKLFLSNQCLRLETTTTSEKQNRQVSFSMSFFARIVPSGMPPRSGRPSRHAAFKFAFLFAAGEDQSESREFRKSARLRIRHFFGREGFAQLLLAEPAFFEYELEPTVEKKPTADEPGWAFKKHNDAESAQALPLEVERGRGFGNDALEIGDFFRIQVVIDGRKLGLRPLDRSLDVGFVDL